MSVTERFLDTKGVFTAFPP